MLILRVVFVLLVEFLVCRLFFNFTMASSSRKRSKSDLVNLSGEQWTRYKAHLDREHSGTRYYDPDFMENLGIHDEVTRLCNIVGLTSLVQTPFPSHPQLTSELLSTFQLESGRPAFRTREATIKFRLGNVDRVLSLGNFNSILGLPNPDHFQTLQPKDLQLFWYRISGNPTCLPRELMALDIIHPCFKVIQRLLGNTIYGRSECNKVRCGEIACLLAMVNNEPLNLGYEFATKLRDLSHKPTGSVVIGGLVTRLARHFRVDTTRYKSLEPCRLDFTHATNTGMFALIEERYTNYVKRADGFISFSPHYISTLEPRQWYEVWVGRRLRPHPDLESESDESEHESEHDTDEINEDQDQENVERARGGDDMMFEAPAYPSTSHFEPGTSSMPQDSSNTDYMGRLSTLERSMAEMRVQQDQLLQMNAHMYHHTFGYYYDPSAPYPRPPDYPPQ